MGNPDCVAPHGLSAVRKVARCAKTQPMRFRLPLLRRPGSDPAILAPASSAPVPTRRNWPFRRSSRGLEARLDRCLQRDNVGRCAAIRPGFDARSPRTPRDARIHATGPPARPLQRATHTFMCQARTFAALLVHLPGRLYNTRRRPALSTPVRRLGATSAFPPTTTAQAVVKAGAPYHRVTKASLAACLANPCRTRPGCRLCRLSLPLFPRRDVFPDRRRPRAFDPPGG